MGHLVFFEVSHRSNAFKASKHKGSIFFGHMGHMGHMHMEHACAWDTWRHGARVYMGQAHMRICMGHAWDVHYRAPACHGTRIGRPMPSLCRVVCVRAYISAPRRERTPRLAVTTQQVGPSERSSKPNLKCYCTGLGNADKQCRENWARVRGCE